MAEFIYLKITGLEVSVDMFHYSSRGLYRLGWIPLFQDISRWKLRKIVRDLM